MTKKIEGWAFEAEGPDRVLWHEPQKLRGGTEAVKATLVIGDERVFTESEVRAMLHDMRSWISPDDGEEGRMWETRAKLHGIVLDPA